MKGIEKIVGRERMMGDRKCAGWQNFWKGKTLLGRIKLSPAR